MQISKVQSTASTSPIGLSGRKVSQTFDERTNEHAVIIEYRVRRGSDGVVTKNRKQKQISKWKLLSKLAAQARAQGL